MKPFTSYGEAASDIASAVEQEAQKFEFEEFGTKGSSVAFGFPILAEGSAAQDLQKVAMAELIPSHLQEPIVSIFWDASTFVITHDVLMKSMSNHLDWRREEVGSSSVDLDLSQLTLSEFFVSAREILVRSTLSNLETTVIALKMGGPPAQVPLKKVVTLLCRLQSRTDCGFPGYTGPDKGWTSGAAALQLAEPYAYLVQAKHKEEAEEFRKQFKFEHALDEAKFMLPTAQVAEVLRRPSASRGLADVLGRGQKSMVYLGTRFEDSQAVAIKVVMKDKLATAEAANLVREMDIWNSISHSQPHENILQALRVFDVSPSELYVVTPFLPLDLQAQIQHSMFAYESEKKSLNKSVLPLPWVRRMTADVAAGLHHLHELQIMHGSVSPPHILLSARIQPEISPPSHLAKLCDFGAAQRIQKDIVLAKPYGMGVDAYLAPELVLSSETLLLVDGSTSCGQGFEGDLWALGVVLHVCAFGAGIFEVSSDEAPKDVVKHLREWKLDTEQLFARIETSCFGELLVRLLERDPSSRLTAQEVLQHDFLSGFREDPSFSFSSWCAWCSPCLTGRGRHQ